MTDVAIRAERLSKQYTLGRPELRHDMLREHMVASLRTLLRRRRERNATANTFWALRDVSFEIHIGEIVGIIGGNGAGKSTLLKVLSRITEPTTGHAHIYGTVGSLLEVGTGFDRELTGRENIYLSGAILGMRKAEIDRAFDEIVAFADIERFLDTPVKCYSSGMYVRLAFAVAAHLRPEILIVDEVLAVGDARFQTKCLNKMRDVGQHGRTVLFVSHNMAAITNLCQRAIWVNGGQIVREGSAQEVVAAYMTSELSTTATREWRDADRAPSGDVARLRAVRVRSEDGTVADTIDIRQRFRVEMEYDIIQAGHLALPSFWFHNEEGLWLFEAPDLDPAWRRRPRPTGRYVSGAWIPGNLLADGRISVSAYVATLHPLTIQFAAENAVGFHVIDSLEPDGARGDWTGRMGGVVRPMLEWTTTFSAS